MRGGQVLKQNLPRSTETSLSQKKRNLIGSMISRLLAMQAISLAGSALTRPGVRRVVISLLLAVFLIGGSIVSLETGLTSDESDEQEIFQINVAAVKSLYLGQPGKFKALQSSDNKYYGIGFHAVAYPVQVLLQSVLKRMLRLDSETALLFGKHPVVFSVFVVSVVVFYRFARFLIRERFIAFAITAAYAAYPYVFGHAMMNVKDCPFMSAYLVCTYLSLRLVKHRLQALTGSFRTDAAALLFATAALASIRLPGLVIVLQYTFTFGLADYFKSGTAGSFARLLRWKNLVVFSVLLIVLVILAYPIFWINPVRETLNGLKFMAWHPQEAYTLTWGHNWEASKTPTLTYLSGWLSVKLPVMVLIGILLVPFAIKRIARDPFQQIVYLTGLFGSLYMLIAVVILRSHLYDETRQLLFIYPLLFLLGSVALYVMSRKLALAAALLSFAIFTWDQVRLHPYQYVYFNEVARFLNIDKLFETDYWGASGREHGRLLANDLSLGMTNTPTCIYADPDNLYRPFIDPRICVQNLLLFEDIPDRDFVLATYARTRLNVTSNCYQLSEVSRTLPISNRKITMAVAYRCSQ